jgi:hypothetical protein
MQKKKNLFGSALEAHCAKRPNHPPSKKDKKREQVRVGREKREKKKKKKKKKKKPDHHACRVSSRVVQERQHVSEGVMSTSSFEEESSQKSKFENSFEEMDMHNQLYSSEK